MNFEAEYQNIKNNADYELNFLEQKIKTLFNKNTPLDKALLNFLTAPAKRLRPLLGILFLKCLQKELNQNQKEVLLAVELIHNATLIHDDIIDNATQRRKQETFNTKFDNNLAVIAGDFLLSVAMEKVINTKSVEVIKLFTSALKLTCLGEINQYFSKFKMTTLDEYIEKSKNKTALLFEISVLGGLLLSENNDNNNLIEEAKDFSQNFGIAFQIRDDLINILNSDSSIKNDIESGIYNAPIIFAYQEDSHILESENLLDSIKNTKGIEKTKDLMDNYFDKAILTIDKFDDSSYKESLIKLINLLRTRL